MTKRNGDPFVKRGPRFGIEKPAIPGPGRPPLSPEVKAARKEARELLKDAAPWMAQRIIDLSAHEDPDVAIKALKVGIDKVLPNLEEVENFEHRPLQQLTDDQIKQQLDIIRSSRNGSPAGNGAAA